MKNYIWVCATFLIASVVQTAEATNYLNGYAGNRGVTRNGNGGYSRLNIGGGASGPTIIGGSAFSINRPHGDQSWKFKKKKRKVVKRKFRRGTPLIYRATPAGNLAPRGLVTPIAVQK